MFIDGIDEVTRFFEGADDPSDAVHRINTEADVIWVDGHSDYGHALTVFWERWGEEMTPQTSVLLLGDARNNYHAPQAWVVKELQARARHVYWLNPEPRDLLELGGLDRRASTRGHCDAVVECRTLRQLERFVGRARVSDRRAGRRGSTGCRGPTPHAPRAVPPDGRPHRPARGARRDPDRPRPPRRGGVQRVGSVRRADRVRGAHRAGSRARSPPSATGCAPPASWPGPSASTRASSPGRSRPPSRHRARALSDDGRRRARRS